MITKVRFDSLWKGFCGIFRSGEHISDDLWHELQLKISDGGAGIPHFQHLAHCAYLASISIMENEVDPSSNRQLYDQMMLRIDNAKIGYMNKLKNDFNLSEDTLEKESQIMEATLKGSAKHRQAIN